MRSVPKVFIEGLLEGDHLLMTFLFKVAELLYCSPDEPEDMKGHVLDNRKPPTQMPIVYPGFDPGPTAY
jgi:hypothetical protein